MPDKKSEIRLRVARLLSGDRRVDDLRRIILFVRQNSYGDKIIRDLGDFIAHADRREKGLAIENANNIFSFFATEIDIIIKKTDIKHRKAIYMRTFKCRLDQIDTESIKQKSKLSVKHVKRLIDGLMPDFELTEDGEPSFRRPLNASETEAFSLISDYHMDYLFDDVHVVESLFYVLNKNNLIAGEDKDLLISISGFVAKFFVCELHLAQILLSGWEDLSVRAGSLADGTITLQYQVPFNDIFISFPFFKTSLNVADSCTDDFGLQQSWSFPIEIDGNERISKL